MPRGPLAFAPFVALLFVLLTLPPSAFALQTYVVQPGDTLSAIAAENGVSVAEIAAENGITDVNSVAAGTQLTIPAPESTQQPTAGASGTYTVQPGDTLSGIADQLGVDMNALATANGISDPSLIFAGEVLGIPGGSPAPAAAPAPAPAATPASAPAASPPPAATSTYTVVDGDTLAGIAARFGIDPSSLANMNSLSDPNLIVIGQLLTVPASPASPSQPASSPSPVATPPPLTHVVSPGETVATIAAQYSITTADLVAANKLANPSLLTPGQVLLIPSVATAVSRAAMRSILQSVEKEFGIPDGLLQALAWQESGWQQHVVSGAGAIGLTQVLPTTALWALQFLVQDANNWQTSALDNARVGGSFLAHLLKLSGGDPSIAVAAYYQGWDSLQANGMYDETRQYVANVLALWPQFKS